MQPVARFTVRAVLLALVSLTPTAAAAQAPQSTLRIRVQDETQAALIHATVTITDPKGVERQVLVNEAGEVTFGLAPGTYQLKVEAEGFRGYTVSYNVRRGNNSAVATLPVALAEEIVVREQSAESLREKGFKQTLSRDEIDSLSDDPDEMAEQLRQMAGPGAQIFVDGFRGGRIPPKDQIEQIRFHTNSFSAEYHDAGMVRVEIITKPGMGDWRGGFNFGFRDESFNARNAFAPERAPEQYKRFHVQHAGPDRERQDQPVVQRRRQSLVRLADDSGQNARGRDQRPGAAARGRGELQRPPRAPARRRQCDPRRVLAPRQHARKPRRRRFRSAGARVRLLCRDRHAAGAQHQGVRQEALQRDARRIQSSGDRARVAVGCADDPRARRVHLRRCRPARHTRGPSVHDRPELRPSGSQTRAAVRRRGQWRLVGQRPADEYERHVHLLDARRLRRTTGRAPIRVAWETRM